MQYTLQEIAGDDDIDTWKSDAKNLSDEFNKAINGNSKFASLNRCGSDSNCFALCEQLLLLMVRRDFKLNRNALKVEQAESLPGVEIDASRNAGCYLECDDH